MSELRAIRKKAIANGMKLQTMAEIRRDIEILRYGA